MEKRKLKFVLIPAFAAATLFPVLGNDAHASDENPTTAAASTTSEGTTSSTTTKPEALASSTNAKPEATTPSASTSSPVASTVNKETTPSSVDTSALNKETAESTTPTATTSVENADTPIRVPLSEAEYKQKSALELADLIKNKKVTSTELVNLAYKIINEENPKLNAVLTTENGNIPKAIIDEAYATAKSIDERIAAGNASSNPVDWEKQPFLGVPTLIKGLDRVKGGDASNGVYFAKGAVSKSDLAVASEFKKLGFIVLGQTNYPELGTRNITDSKLFGTANNPWDPSRNTGGSSGGSAGAVASGMVSIASGSDAGGSIRIPSSWTGLIGLKPTGAIVKFPLVKDVKDAKVYFEKTNISKPKKLVEVPKDLKSLKIAYSLKTPLKDVELSEDGKKAVLKTVDFLKKQGFTVEEVSDFPVDGYEGIRTYTVGAIGEPYTSAAKLANETTKYDLDPATYALGTSTKANTDTSSAKPYSLYKKQMNDFYKKYDLFLMATNAVTAPSNDKNVDPYVDPEVEKQLYNINDIKDPKARFDLLVKQWEPMMRRTPFTWLFNLTRNPAITLPVYKNDTTNLPLGVMFAAQDNSEKILLEMAQLFQDNNQFVMNPAIRNTATTANGNKVGTNDYGTNFEYNTGDAATAEPEIFTGELDGLTIHGNKGRINPDGTITEYKLPEVAPEQEELPIFTPTNSEQKDLVKLSSSTNSKEDKTKAPKEGRVLPKTSAATNTASLLALGSLLVLGALKLRKRF